MNADDVARSARAEIVARPARAEIVARHARAEIVARFTVAADHPALPGHFPGRPIVPGVLLLDQAIETARIAFGLGAATGLPRAKFLSPVLPGEEVEIAVALSRTDRIAFTCRVGERVVATGDAEFIIASTSDAESAG